MPFPSPEELEPELRISGWEGVANRAECCLRGKLVRGVEIRVVEGVVHLCPELQPRNLSQAPIFLNRQIPVLIAGATDGCNIPRTLSNEDCISSILPATST